jgi:uncharacterized protein
MTQTNSINDLDVTWLVDEIEVSASLTRPAGPGPFPAVILVAGSGPTDRNWNSPIIPGSNGSGALVAHALTEAGFVTLRYDKRVTGPHAQDNLPRMMGKISKQSHLDELAGGVRLLAGREDVDRTHIFALTNSEGCLHALNYQLQGSELPFAGLVLTGAPARAVGDVGRGQIAAQLAAYPGGDQILAAYDAAIADFTAGRELKMNESLPQGIRDLLMSLSNPINQPFSRELWTADPGKWVTGVTCPVLVVIGKKDIQVDWLTDGPIFEEIARRQSNLALAYPENANHVLKFEPKLRSELTVAEIMQNYNADGIALDPETLGIILDWLKARI